jgi:hypothetical protein
LTVREVSEEVSLSKTVCHEILTENLGMHRIPAKFVPRLLTDDQKQNRVDVSIELLDRANDDNWDWKTKNEKDGRHGSRQRNNTDFNT